MLVYSFISGLVLGAFFAAILLSLLTAGKKKDSPYCTCPACNEKIYLMDEDICKV
jgi:prepilin signal peptidase PulO-like enzyme (type II secretory pathway)